MEEICHWCTQRLHLSLIRMSILHTYCRWQCRLKFVKSCGT